MRRSRTATILPILLAFACFHPHAHAGDPAPRPWVVYLLPHSHVDIGYTHVQTEVERIHREVLDKALELCRKTADYPPGARFKWNAEVLWQVDDYLRKAPPQKQRELVKAVRAGQVGLDAFYGNELTGLCRPEELLRLLQPSVTIGRRCGVAIDSAMLSDVPGLTWGVVPAMAEAGVNYLSLGPNLSVRIGRTLSQWENRPFYWLAPDRKRKVLCWTSARGYTFGATIGYKRDAIPKYLTELEKSGYPYDLVQVRWTRGDNQPPDATLSDAVKQWNATHASPRLVIATTAEMFREFEKRYADKIPSFSGDFTPYWEDGAASSARETAINRASAERLVQAETLTAMLNRPSYRAKAFGEAWRNVVLYDEHTWGARQWDVKDYNVPFIRDQWKIKQAFALDGETQSRVLLDEALAERAEDAQEKAVDVFNTSSWPRTDLVVLSRQQSPGGDVVTHMDGKPVPSQRLSTGELAFFAKEVPALAGRRYLLQPGKAATTGRAKAEDCSLWTPTVAAHVDPASGAIDRLRHKAIGAELCDASGVGLNRYDYVVRDRLKDAKQAANAKVRIQEAGPLVASLVIESDAPGCNKLVREVRLVDGLDRVDVVNTLDKKEVREKEGVHFGFAFHVPDGTMRIDIPWAVFRPEVEQLPGACKEWLCTGRWADVSNKEYGVTWAATDAPLVEIGGITAGLVGNAEDPKVWLAKLPPSQTIYSWVMNNYWPTNYKAFQSGPTAFRYRLLPHGPFDQAAAQRFGIESSQPLLVRPAQGAAPSERPLLELDTPDVIVASAKPSDDRRATIVRLFAAAGRPATTRLAWGRNSPKTVWISNLAEERVSTVTGPIELPGYGLVTLRAE